jgi:hypothetical protein
MTPKAFAKTTIAHLTTEGALRPGTLAQVAEIIEHFGTFLEASQGLARINEVGLHHAAAFINSRRMNGALPTYGLRRVRRMALRMAFRAGRQLGLLQGDPTIDIRIGPMAHVGARPLTDEEVDLGRSYALPSLRDRRRCIAWAMAEATGRTSEIGRVRIRDVDLHGCAVRLPGSSVVDPRTGRLTSWGAAQLRRRLDESSDPNESLIVWRSPPKDLRAASSQAITETLKAAGLHGPDVRPRSIVAWAGRRALEDGAPIEAVASMLGMRSLDQAADFVGLRWQGEAQP